jgi:excisionase family DNA binding protein
MSNTETLNLHDRFPRRLVYGIFNHRARPSKMEGFIPFRKPIISLSSEEERKDWYSVEQEHREWMKVPEAAEYFNVPRSRMYDLIQRGELPAVRIGQRSLRVNRREAERFLRENRSAGPPR